MTAVARNSTGFRTLGEDMSLIDIHDYGCWCIFDADYRKGRGPTKDSIDVSCRRLHQGYKCIEIDHAAFGESCISYAALYENVNPGNSFLAAREYTEDTGKMWWDIVMQECETINAGNPCNIDSCKVETNFILETFYSVQMFRDANPSLKHAIFDHGSTCGL